MPGLRHLLANSGVWDHEAYGTPLHAAHLGLSTTVFSMRLEARRVGGRYVRRGRAGERHEGLALYRPRHGSA